MNCSKCQKDLRPKKDNVCDDCYWQEFNKEARDGRMLKLGNSLQEQTQRADGFERENLAFRYLLWMNHGHIHSLNYGEDGERYYCGECKLDFKVAPLRAIRRREEIRS